MLSRRSQSISLADILLELLKHNISHVHFYIGFDAELRFIHTGGVLKRGGGRKYRNQTFLLNIFPFQ